MKKSKLVLAVLVVFSLSLVFDSCKKPDEEKPTLRIDEPENGEVFDSGNTMHIEGLAKDNKALSQLKIDIHDAFDGHSHGKITSSVSAFELVKIVNLEGKEVAFHEDINIPTNVLAGKYHITVSVVDEAGNLSNVEERDVFIRNSSDLIAPTITVVAPYNNQTVELNGTLQLIANIADNDELEEVIVKIYNASNNKVFEWEVDHIHAATYELNHTANLNGLPAGNYKVEIIAIDHVNNSTDIDIDIVIQ